jgi:hypothetical protein
MSIKPVTLTQLHGATKVDDVLHVDGRELSMVKFMGSVSSVLAKRDGPTSTLYYIQDALSGGCLACLVYDEVKHGEEEVVTDEALLEGHTVARALERRQELVVDKYYMFHGVPRYLDKSRGQPRSHIHIDVVHARLVTDCNELTYHGLDVIHTHLLHTK